MTGSPALEVVGVTVRYGRTEGVVDASLTVGVDEIVALIGANGAGKSSLLKAVAGIERCSDGRIVVGAADVTDLPAHRRIAHGLVLVPEGRGVFRELTVAENLALGSFLRHRPQQRDAVNADLSMVFELFPRLHERRRQIAGTLSGGEQQMLAIGRAVMTHPKLLVLDEPSLGLAPKVIDEIVLALRAVKASRGLAILVAEQNAVLGLGMADRGYVLRNGRVVMTGAASELAADRELIDLYLGNSSNEAERKAA